MKRSKDRLYEIDTFLRMHYIEQGGRFCADGLGEKITYISSRVQHIGIVSKPKEKIRPKASEIAILEGKIVAKNREIEELYGLLKEEKRLRHETRAENVRLISEKHKLKRALKAEEA